MENVNSLGKINHEGMKVVISFCGSTSNIISDKHRLYIQTYENQMVNNEQMIIRKFSSTKQFNNSVLYPSSS